MLAGKSSHKLVRSSTSRAIQLSEATMNPETLAEMPPPPDLKCKPELKNCLLVRNFNDVFICFLCGGYKIDATVINECMHSYCRTCIVKYLEVRHYCPECFNKKFVVNADGTGGLIRNNYIAGQQSAVNSPRIITSQNLHLDKVLMTLIYKLVPDLYKREMNDVETFYSKQSHLEIASFSSGNHFERNLFSRSSGRVAGIITEDPVIVSADEPISLSLEYHPKELQHVGNISHENIPKKKYLQCPAGARIFHLEKFLCAKFNLSPLDYQVDILYGDEVLRKNFNLMDVIYSFKWKMDSPMRFFYRIMEISFKQRSCRRLGKVAMKENKDFAMRSKIADVTSMLPGVVLNNRHDLSPSEIGNNRKSEHRSKLTLSMSDQALTNVSKSSEMNTIEDSKLLIQGNTAGKERVGSKRKLKDEYLFVEEFTNKKSSPRSSTPQKQASSKSVTFSDTVLAARIPIIKPVDSAMITALVPTSTLPTKDFTRLRSNDITSNSSTTKSASKIPPSSPTLAVPATTTNTINVQFSATGSCSGSSSGTVPVNNSQQLGSNQPQPVPHLFHGESSSFLTIPVNDAKIHAHQQSGDKKSDKFTTRPIHQEPANTQQNMGTKTNSACNTTLSTIPSNAKQSISRPAQKNDRNGNFRQELNQNMMMGTNMEKSSTRTATVSPEKCNNLEKKQHHEEEEDKYEYIRNIGLKPIHEVKTNQNSKIDDKTDDAHEKRRESIGSTDIPLSVYPKKRKKSKHSSDFPFADSKKKKVDYDLAISATNVPKSSTDQYPTNRLTDSLKMKFIKVVPDKNSSQSAVSIPSDKISAECDPSQYVKTIGEETFLTGNHSMDIKRIVKDISRQNKSPPALGLATIPKGRNILETHSANVIPITCHSQLASESSSLSPRSTMPKTQTTGDSASRNKIRASNTPYTKPHSPFTSMQVGSSYLSPLQIQMFNASEKVFQKSRATTQQSEQKIPNVVPSAAGLPKSLTMVVKKPLPPLLPPSSFGKFNSMPHLIATGQHTGKIPDKPPMVEIVRLPSDLNNVVTTKSLPVKSTPKANRPPPPTIPLVKIRRTSANSSASTESMDGLPPLPSKSPLLALERGSTVSQKPLPKLNEISKIARVHDGSLLIRRQPSASVRSVPNPSALALRNQLQNSRNETCPMPKMMEGRVEPPAMVAIRKEADNRFGK